MTDRIKSAHDVQVPILMDDGTTKWVSKAYLFEALSAYEKLQGVDGMKKDTTNHQELLAKCDDLTVGYNDGYNQAIDDVKARLVADIGWDG